MIKYRNRFHKFTVSNSRAFSKCLVNEWRPTARVQNWSHPPSNIAIADNEIGYLTSKPTYELSLADLLKYSDQPLTADALLLSVNFTRSLLPVRLAHRIKALRNLPFIVVTNPSISKVYNIYLQSLAKLLPYSTRLITTIDEEKTFTGILVDLVETHSHTISTLAQGFLECRKYVNANEISNFLDEHIRARIGTRLIAEQHIALHHFSHSYKLPDPATKLGDSSSNYIGVLDTNLAPESTVNCCGSFVSEICELNYGVRPTWIVEGDNSTTFTFVPMHLEYIITELLKNAFRATVESGNSKQPIIITIATKEETSSNRKVRPLTLQSQSQEKREPDIESQGVQPVSGITIRIRDRGGGISPAILPKIWSYSFTTFSEKSFPDTTDNLNVLDAFLNPKINKSQIAGLGYGLPLSRAYAEYFGGGISIQSLHGWGCDVYLRLRGLDWPRGRED
ncbi:BgTH12-03207 [Blumeria graminis f. sp. triticale]|uniref:Protein-serine/threonine kinase n=3 Tax=Blumeria graminis TaxID=34373 RepID=A0A061HJK2_BLUGR|nr:Mitochondrial protein kinase [Blumeria graminis f. sp. tritici 96224]CAD6503546.1 BgTH12-03207 [Blumeria graminis f. sp. triticale]VDB89684.1 Bgt-1408 [Blumeria graminis f. sp. tritici]